MLAIVFYTLAAVLIYLSYKSLHSGIDYLNYFKKELAKRQPAYTPFSTIIAPCKGLDEGLRENLAVLLNQEYPDYEVIFVVDNETDPAVAVIEEVSRKGTKIAKLIVAPKAVDSSQKIENLREAVLHVSERSEIFVFVDSDGRPAKDWLRHLIAPLEDESIGAATGYRWFISKNPSFASEMRSIWNASIASALGASTKSNFCWGGSMAIRRQKFERLDIREKWNGTLSDDFVVTRTMNAAGLPIYFVPQALTASIEDCTFHELLEFTTRQMKITRVYAPNLWMLSYFGSSIFNVVMIGSLIIIILNRSLSPETIVALVTLMLVTALSLAKSTLRLKTVEMVLRDYSSELGRQYWSHNILTLLAPGLFLYNCIAASVSRRLTWRGVTYQLTAADKIEIVASKGIFRNSGGD